jgi:hypothetical protein
MPLVRPVPGGPATVDVRKTEEKGSDVNLATYLAGCQFPMKLADVAGEFSKPLGW